jgi:hypothetical protein
MNDDIVAADPLDCGRILHEEFEFLHGDLPVADGADPVAREKAVHAAVHALPPEEMRTALCFSGGGIRSATFCLGVLQALSQNGWLGRFHYLSTVSGGGYIGSWLSSWLCRTGDAGLVFDRLNPSGPASSPEPRPIQRLRAYCNYLSPVWGFSIDLLTLIATFLRNLLLHWTVLLPLLAAVLVLPRLHLALVEWPLPGEASAQWCLGAAVVLAVIGIAYIVSDLPREVTHRPRYNFFLSWCFAPMLCATILLSLAWAWYARHLHCVPVPAPACPDWPAWYYMLGGALLHLLGVGVGIVFRRYRATESTGPLAARDPSGRYWDFILVVASGAAGGFVLYFLSTSVFSVAWLWTDAGDLLHRELYSVLCVPFLLASFWVGTTMYVGLARARTSENDREWWARSGAWWLAAGMAWMALGGLVIFATEAILQAAGPHLVGPWGGALGLITGLYGYWSKQGEGLGGKVKGLLASAGSGLFEIAALVFIAILFVCISYGISRCLQPLIGSVALRLEYATMYATVLHGTDPIWLGGAVIVLVALGISASWFCGTNTFSLHGMYGNRLVRAYLGATREQRRPHRFTGFDPLDSLSMNELHKVMQITPRPERRLFHVVNIALNMVGASGDRLEWQQRKAASFTASPMHTGAASVGYQPSATYTGGSGMSLARAMTISGAAASPNMGYHSSKLVAFVMMFFNIRLGWWLPNPGEAGSGAWQRSEPSVPLYSTLEEAMASTTDTSSYVYLSDGGHFENLGLYEMVRRRCKGIVLVDAGCDPKYEFGDLENAVRKIRTDLGISITFPNGLPTPAAVRSGIPGREHCHFALGAIRYSDVDGPGTDGRLIYVKPVVSGDEPLDVTRYAAASRGQSSPFPHHTTGDQFFDESQFESYRMLGYHSASVNFPAAGVWPEALPDGRDAGEAALSGDQSSAAGGAKALAVQPCSGGLSDMLRSWSQATLLGATLTVGGVLGVSGTVAMRDGQVALKPGSEISINKDQMTQLQSGIPIRYDEIPQALKDQLNALNGALVSLQATISANATTNSGLVARVREMLESVTGMLDSTQIRLVVAQMSTLNERLRSLELQLRAGAGGGGGTGAPDYTADLRSIRDAIDAINGTVAGARLGARMDGIDKKLDLVKDQVQRTAPRANVRGTAEGGAR